MQDLLGAVEAAIARRAPFFSLLHELTGDGETVGEATADDPEGLREFVRKSVDAGIIIPEQVLKAMEVAKDEAGDDVEQALEALHREFLRLVAVERVQAPPSDAGPPFMG